MRIAIAFPVINCLDFTKAAVASIRSTHEIVKIVVDNGSTDDTVRWAVSEVQWVVQNHENKGLTVAWNQAVERARNAQCEYVLLANNDILFNPHTIDALVTELTLHPDWAMATGCNNRSWCDANGGPEAIATMPIPAHSDAEAPDFSCFLLRIAAYDRIGPFDEEFSLRGRAYFEDNDYHYRCRLMGMPCRSVTSAPYYHYASKTQHQGAEPIVKGHMFEANRSYFVQKWGGMPGSETFREPFNGHAPS